MQANRLVNDLRPSAPDNCAPDLLDCRTATYKIVSIFYCQCKHMVTWVYLTHLAATVQTVVVLASEVCEHCHQLVLHWLVLPTWLCLFLLPCHWLLCDSFLRLWLFWLWQGPQKVLLKSFPPIKRLNDLQSQCDLSKHYDFFGQQRKQWNNVSHLACTSELAFISPVGQSRRLNMRKGLLHHVSKLSPLCLCRRM